MSVFKKKKKGQKQKSYDLLDKKINIMRTFLAIGIGLALSIVIIFIVSDNPLLSIRYFIFGPLMNKNNFYGLVVMWIPIVFTGLAVSMMFSANQFNLFAEGAFFFGGAVATMLSLSMNLPKGIHAFVAILGASLVTGIIGAIPAIMKHRLNSSEMVASIMLNYIVMYLGLFLISAFFRDATAGSVVSLELPETARLNELIPRSNIHIGFFIALAFVVIVYLFMYHTRWGYEIRLVGKNAQFAEYSGVKIGFITILSQILGSALAGAAGAIDTLALYSRFSWTTLTNHGWDGVTLAIIAQNNPKYIPLAAFFLAYLRKGADLMSMKTGMQTDFVSIIQAVILVFLLAQNFLSKYKQKQVEKLTQSLKTEGGC